MGIQTKFGGSGIEKSRLARILRASRRQFGLSCGHPCPNQAPRPSVVADRGHGGGSEFPSCQKLPHLAAVPERPCPGAKRRPGRGLVGRALRGRSEIATVSNPVVKPVVGSAAGRERKVPRGQFRYGVGTESMKGGTEADRELFSEVEWLKQFIPESPRSHGPVANSSSTGLRVPAPAAMSTRNPRQQSVTGESLQVPNCHDVCAETRKGESRRQVKSELRA